jgi:hypothetical protein
VASPAPPAPAKPAVALPPPPAPSRPAVAQAAAAPPPAPAPSSPSPGPAATSAPPAKPGSVAPPRHATAKPPPPRAARTASNPAQPARTASSVVASGHARASAEDPKKKAEEHFKLAEEALARGDLKAAENHSLLAMKGDEHAVEYAALHTWVLSQAGVPLPESVRTFSRLLEDHPECQPALYYRGMLLKKAGKDRAALRDFVTVVRLNPDHVKALGEVKALRARLPPK